LKRKSIQLINSIVDSGFAPRFTGKERDAESGNDYFGVRYYASSMGRFMSPDPGPWKLNNPQYLNMYAYVLNNPLRNVDVAGETPQDRVNEANALAAQNIPYVWGGKNPAIALDCSGLVAAAFKTDPDNPLDIKGTAAQENGELLGGGESSTDINDAKPGDAIFFSGETGDATVHTGIVLDVRGGEVYFVHAPTTGDHVKQSAISMKTKIIPKKGGGVSLRFKGVGRPMEPGPINKPPVSMRLPWYFILFPSNPPPPPPPPKDKHGEP
jgi:RHS repeat-associated protein